MNWIRKILRFPKKKKYCRIKNLVISNYPVKVYKLSWEITIKNLDNMPTNQKLPFDITLKIIVIIKVKKLTYIIIYN